jgi:threonine/homoserine/homoserine lactone efflux protein
VGWQWKNYVKSFETRVKVFNNNFENPKKFMNIFIFLVSSFAISCSGAMSPGPVTAAAISLGMKNRHAGIMIAIGHALVEFPLIFLLTVGLERLVKTDIARIATGFLGGAILLFMAWGLISDIKKGIHFDKADRLRRGPVMTGIFLSVSNPYFLIWWATIGLGLTTRAIGFGYWLLPVFALVHWLADLIWLELVTYTTFKGAALAGRKGMTAALSVCAVLLAGFGLYFLTDTIRFIIRLN